MKTCRTKGCGNQVERHQPGERQGLCLCCYEELEALEEEHRRKKKKKHNRREPPDRFDGFPAYA